jgi:hypothetical protein
MAREHFPNKAEVAALTIMEAFDVEETATYSAMREAIEA